MKDAKHTTTPLVAALEKSHIGERVDIEFWMERLTSFPEGEWFCPNNSALQDHSICIALAELRLIEKWIQPIWSNGTFVGQRTLFRYKNDLLYTTPE